MKIGKNPCPKCRENGHDDKGDNLYHYGEGLGSYCFSCGYTVLSDVQKEARGIDAFDWFENMEAEVSTREKLTKEELDKIKGYTGQDGQGTRGITNETYKAYAVRFKYNEEDGEVVEHYYPYTEDSVASGYKVRTLPKTFSVVGKIGSGSDLFGQWKFKNSSGKFCVLVAGEVDCLSAFQMLEDKRKSGSSSFDPIPVVSAATGENGSHKQIAKHYEWFDRFQHVIVIYDQDPTGKEAVKELVKVLPKGKMCVVDLPAKDINKMLEDGKQQEFVNAFWKYHPYTPDGIIGSSQLRDKLREYAATEKIPLPPFMSKVQKLMAGGIPLGVTCCLGSSSGSGKSTFTDEMLFFWIYNSPHKVGVISLESDSGSYAMKILSRRVGRKIELIESVEDKLAYLDSPEVLAAENDLYEDEQGNNRFYLIEDRDGGWKNMQASIMNLIVTCGVKVIVIDPLQDLMAGMSLEQQEQVSSWLKGVIKSHGVTFILINHVRKNSNSSKANSQGADLTEEDFHGSSTIFKSSACNLLFNRNKEAEDPIERNTTIMKMSKCRWSGQTSPYAGKFFYDNATHILHDFDEYMSTHGPKDF